jgi:hypothetical protein
MAGGNTPVTDDEGPRTPLSRFVALVPVWLLLRLLALGLPRAHSLRRLSLTMFFLHARERAFWVGVALYTGIAVWLRILSAILPSLREALTLIPLGP